VKGSQGWREYGSDLFVEEKVNRKLFFCSVCFIFCEVNAKRGATEKVRGPLVTAFESDFVFCGGGELVNAKLRYAMGDQSAFS